MAAFSMRAIIIGVASTGMSPEPTEAAVLSAVTSIVEVCLSPVSIMFSRLGDWSFSRLGYKINTLFHIMDKECE